MNIYEGTENYIFVSYAHADSDRVMPIIEALDKEGFRIWYDSGIEAGAEWAENLDRHLDTCYGMIVFITPASVASRNCRSEIGVALNLNKEILVVYLEETELMYGLRYQLASIQAIHRNKFDSDNSFIDALSRAGILQSCKKEKTGDTISLDVDTKDEQSLYNNGTLLYLVKDYFKAMICFRAAAEKGYAPAQFSLGECYREGNGVEQDINKAALWYRKSAEQGYTKAQCMLGLLYKGSWGHAQDYSEYFYWTQKAAEQGYDVAFAMMGECYHNGYGCEQDYDKSFYWFQKAADSGNKLSYRFLGSYYYNGQGVARDYTKAVYWLQKASDNGDVDSQLFLATCYLQGNGVERDISKTAEILTKAAAQGSEKAKELLDILKQYGVI